MMTDQDIISEFSKLNHPHNKYAWFLFHSNQEIKNYIHDRYDDSNSNKESLQRILYHINDVPLCPICRKRTIYIGRPNRIYSKYCSNECKFKDIDLVERHKEGCLKKYGVENISQVKKIKEKKEKTFLSHFGTKNNYGRPSVVNAIFNARKLNNSLNTSKPEEELYLYIKEKFPSVRRQYKDNVRYPWRCDFYIPELDCFMEYQGFQGHGKHPYDPNSIEDQTIVKEWNKRYDNGEHPLYKRMMENWTIKDVKKRNCAKEHGLNFKEVWSLNEGKAFIDNLYTSVKNTPGTTRNASDI